MLKRLFFLIIISLIAISCNSKSGGYVIKGIITNASGKTLYLDKVRLDKVETIDSVKISDEGNFTFSGKLSEPGIFLLRFSNTNYLYLIADTTDKIDVNADAANIMATYRVEGSLNSKLLKEVNSHNLESTRKVDSLRAIFKNSETSPKMDSIKICLDNSFTTILNDEKQFLMTFIQKNCCSFASFMALYQQLGPRNYILNITNDFQYFNLVDSCLSMKYPSSSFLTSLHSQVSVMKNELYAKTHAKDYNIGDFADEISLPAPDGRIVKLSSLKGKYVLIDFWASWCKPCRAENPNVVMNYNKYHSKGFEIYGVSLDQDKNSWINAINKDKLTWIQVSDLKIWNCPVAIQYRIEGIPANFLLDKKGKIIGKNLRGAELGAKLARNI